MSGSPLVLFGNRLSPFVEKIARCLLLKRQSFDLVEPTSPFEFPQWNPQTRKIPVLQIDSERIVDSTFIARRLDELFPDPPLLSKIAVVAAAQRNLEDWSDEAFYWYSMALRWSPEYAAATARQLAQRMSAPWKYLARAVLPKQLRKAVIAQGMGRLPTTVVLRELAHHLDDLLLLLADKPFFYSRMPSIADFALYGQFTLLCSGPTPEAGALFDRRPGLLDFMRRVEDATAG